MAKVFVKQHNGWPVFFFVSGGTVGPDGAIYGIPSHARSVAWRIGSTHRPWESMRNFSYMEDIQIKGVQKAETSDSRT